MLYGENARGEEPQAGAGEPPDQVLGEHAQSFLELLVVGKADVELPERLRPPVRIGDDVGSDLVLEQGLDAPQRNPRARPHQQVAVGDDQPRVVVAYLDAALELRISLAIVRELLLGARRELRRTDGAGGRFVPGARRHALEQPAREIEQRRVGSAEEQDASGDEVLGQTIGEHVEPPIEVDLLPAEQVLERGVLDPLDRDLPQPALEEARIDRQRPVGEAGLAREALPAEGAPGGVRVGRRHVEQQVEGIAHLRQLPVHLPDGLDHAAPAQRVEVRRAMGGLTAGELEEGSLERAIEAAVERPPDHRKGLAGRGVAVDLGDLDSDQVDAARSGRVAGEEGPKTGGRDPRAADGFHLGGLLLQLDAAQRLLEDLGGRGDLGPPRPEDAEVRLAGCRSDLGASFAGGPDLDDQKGAEARQEHIDGSLHERDETRVEPALGGGEQVGGLAHEQILRPRALVLRPPPEDA